MDKPSEIKVNENGNAHIAKIEIESTKKDILKKLKII